MKKYLKGQEIAQIRTLGSWNDGGCVEVIDSHGNSFRMAGSRILQMVNEFVFLIEKKRKYSYLVEAIILDEFDKMLHDIGYWKG